MNRQDVSSSSQDLAREDGMISAPDGADDELLICTLFVCMAPYNW